MGFVAPSVSSTHAENNLGETLYRAVLALRPITIVEFGVLHGYSTMCIAQALRDLGQGHLLAYDLWDNFPYNHGDRREVQERIRQAGLSGYVTLGQRDFFDWLREPDEFNLLYVDIAHDGRAFRAAATALRSHLAKGAVVILEGGSEERDKVWWMERFNKEPIHPLRDVLGFRVLDGRFPALSIMPREALTNES